MWSVGWNQVFSWCFPAPFSGKKKWLCQHVDRLGSLSITHKHYAIDSLFKYVPGQDFPPKVTAFFQDKRTNAPTNTFKNETRVLFERVQKIKRKLHLGSQYNWLQRRVGLTSQRTWLSTTFLKRTYPVAVRCRMSCMLLDAGYAIHMTFWRNWRRNGTEKMYLIRISKSKLLMYHPCLNTWITATDLALILHS